MCTQVVVEDLLNGKNLFQALFKKSFFWNQEVLKTHKKYKKLKLNIWPYQRKNIGLSILTFYFLNHFQKKNLCRVIKQMYTYMSDMYEVKFIYLTSCWDHVHGCVFSLLLSSAHLMIKPKLHINIVKKLNWNFNSKRISWVI